MTTAVKRRPSQRKPQHVDEDLMTCWLCGYRGRLRIVGDRPVVVHGRGWVCGSTR